MIKDQRKEDPNRILNRWLCTIAHPFSWMVGSRIYLKAPDVLEFSPYKSALKARLHLSIYGWPIVIRNRAPHQTGYA